MMMMSQGSRTEGGLQLDADGLCAVGRAHAGGDGAAADVPLAEALVHEHQCAGRQHVWDLAHEDEEHRKLVHDQRDGDGNQHAQDQRQAVPQVHAHEDVGGAAGQRAGRHVKSVGGHGDGGRDGEDRRNRHGAQDVDHVVDG